jgi:hypothetical protein
MKTLNQYCASMRLKNYRRHKILIEKMDLKALRVKLNQILQAVTKILLKLFD